MKGEIIDIGVYIDEFNNRTYRIVVEFTENPKHIHLGNAEIKQ